MIGIVTVISIKFLRSNEVASGCLAYILMEFLVRSQLLAVTILFSKVQFLFQPKQLTRSMIVRHLEDTTTESNVKLIIYIVGISYLGRNDSTQL